MQKNIKKKFTPLSYLFFKQLFETNINTTLNMLNNRIENVLISSDNNNAATLGEVGNLLQSTSSEKYLLLAGNDSTTPITGNLTFNEKTTISQISLPENDTDAVPFQKISSTNNNFLTEKGTSFNNPFTGNISFDKAHLITGISNPNSSLDAVNFETLLSYAKKFFLITGDSLLDSLNMNNQTLTNLSNPTSPLEAVNLQTAIQINNSLKEKTIPLTGTTTNKPITGNITLRNTKITQLGDATNNSEAVNLNILNKTLINYLPLKGSIIEGNLNLNNHLILNLGFPRNNLDLINKKYLHDSLSSFVKLSGSTLNGDINLNNFSIVNLKNPEISLDGVNLYTLKNHSDIHLKASYIPIHGNNSTTLITGNLVFNNNATITNISDPFQNEDLINLKTLHKAKNNYVLLSGSSLKGNINLNNNSIYNISNPTNNNEVLNFQTLNNILINQENTYISFKGNSNNKPISGNLVLNNTFLSQIPSVINNLDVINLSDLNSFFTKKFLLLGGSFSALLSLNNQKITNLSNSQNDNDAVTLQTINTHLTSYLPLLGGSINYELNINNKTINELSNSPQDQEAINLQTLNNTISTTKGNFISLFGNTNSKPITGNLFFNNIDIITGLNLPKENLDAINFLSLKNTSNKYLLLQGGSLTNTLNMEYHSIINVPDITNENTFSQLINYKTLDNKLSPYFPLSGGILKGTVNCNNHLISKTSSPTKNSDIINKDYFSSYLHSIPSLIPITGNSKEKEISGNLTFKNSIITGLANPNEETEAVNFQTLNTKFSPYMPLSGGTLTGPLIVKSSTNQTIFNVPNPIESNDAIPLKYAKNLISQLAPWYLHLTGSTEDSPITGNLIFKDALVTGLADPISLTDAVNLQTVNSKFSSYMPLSGGTLSGSLSLGNQKITNLSNPSTKDEAVNYSYLQQLLSNSFKQKIPLSGTLPDLPITENINLGNKFTVLNVSNAIENSQPINFSQLIKQQASYFPLSGGKINGNLDLSNFKIINLKLAEKNSQLISLQNLYNFLKNYLPLSGTSTSSILTNDLIFNGNSLPTGLAQPTQDTDAINLSSLKEKANSYLTLSGGTMKGPLSTIEILNLKNSSSNSSPISYQQAQSILSSKLLSLNGNSSSNPVEQDFIFNNSSLITGLKDAIDNTDAINLQNLKTKFSTYMPLSGGIMSGSINANNQIINHLTPNINKDKTQALTLADVKNSYINASYSLLASRKNQNATWSSPDGPLVFNWSDGELVKSNNADNFYNLGPFGNTQLGTIIFPTGVYLFNISILSNNDNANSVSIIAYLSNSASTITTPLTTLVLSPSSSTNFTTIIQIPEHYSGGYLCFVNNSNNIKIFGISYSVLKLG